MQKSKVKRQTSLLVVLSLTLPFAFCDLPFDLLFKPSTDQVAGMKTRNVVPRWSSLVNSMKPLWS